MTAERFAASQRRTGLGRFEVTRGERRNAIKKEGCIYGALLAQYVRAARRELRYLSKRNLVLASRVQHLERWVHGQSKYRLRLYPQGFPLSAR